MPKVLTDAQIELFMDAGYAHIERAFDPAIADRVAELAYGELKLNPNDRNTWTQSRHLIQKSFKGDDVAKLHSERVAAAIDDLVGEGRWIPFDMGTGYVLVNLPGFDEPPWREVGVHVDGIHFHHHLTSPEQGLIGLFWYSDGVPTGAGTAIRPGSHRITARILADAEPAGMTCQEIGAAARDATAHIEPIEVIAQRGDMVLMHPFLVHGSSVNLGGRIRLASNICVRLHQPMNFFRTNEPDYSPVERAVVGALTRVQ